MSEREDWFDAEIAPALMALAAKCRERGMAMVATVEYEPGERSSTMSLPDGAGLEMQMLRMCANAGKNVDAYMIGLTRFCEANGIRTDSSMFLSRFTPA
jgi:hypothetical protein